MDGIILDIFAFLLGLIAGSFLNCVIYRIEAGKSFIKERSICPKCKHILAWYDLFPILSFMALRGKCRYCKEKISWQYPAVELLTAIIFVWIFNYFIWYEAIFYCVITSLLIIVFIYDLKHFIIPDRITFLGIGLLLVVRIWDLIGHWSLDIGILEKWNFFLASIGAGAFFLAIYLISHGKWMGFGDVKLAFLMGLLLGHLNILIALFLSFLMGGFIGICLILTKKKQLKSEVPFGPFLAAGAFIALLWGDKILLWYLNLLKI
ncbi:MAG: prepilin peptidase [bacterium]|nr:prepilin peptidase [bacterium]